MSALNRYTLERDESGRPRARWEGPGAADPLVADFLETDLGHDRAYADHILAEGYKVAAGTSQGWSSTGNAFALRIGPEGARIRSLFGRGTSKNGSTFPLTDFLALLGRWRAILDEPKEAADA